MRKSLMTLLILIISYGGQAQNNLWSQSSEDKVQMLPKVERDYEILKSKIYHLDINQLKNVLVGAVDRASGEMSDLVLPFPSANGHIQHYRIYEASIMHKELEQKFPDIKSYIGIGIEDKTSSIRFSTTIFGFHGMIFSGNNPVAFIDPYTQDLNNYIVYYKKNTQSTRTFECLTEGLSPELPKDMPFSPVVTQGVMTNGSLRKYRLAMACTIEYAAFHINMAGVGSGTLAQKKAAVMAAMVVTMTRVNGIYERELSVTMEFVPNNDLVIFITSDNFDNNNAGVLIDQSQTVIDGAIGFNNYDIGHTVSTGGGGLAQLYSPCSSSKARGITGSNAPVGDAYDVDYVAHEIGHQFGANHIFNNSCSGNRNNSTAVEPGSGSTIMGYAGICPPNVQNNSDAYFHAVSLAEIQNFILNYGTCSVNINTGNSKPTIAPLVNYTIPKGTAFVLKGNGADTDGDALTYCWEQTNAQVSTQPPSATSTSGPNFRSIAPSQTPNRYIPSLDNVLQGNLTPTWEVIPNTGRIFNFALTVRDNGLNGGEFARRDMTVTTSNTIGPFRVTSQGFSENWTPGDQQTIAWLVAGTTGAPVNTTHVNILLSIDGGNTFDYILASNTPNDGSEVITVPNVGTPNARIMIEAVNNIFYAVNSAPFSIGDCSVYSNATQGIIPDGIGANTAGTPLISTLNITDDVIVNDLRVPLNINHTWNGDLIVRLEHPNGAQVLLWNRTCDSPQTSGINVVFDQQAEPILCDTPTSGTFRPVGDLSDFDGLSAQGEWKLIITDNWNGDSGTLLSWGLDFGCAPMSTDMFGLENFKLYPNPNNGSFMITFDSTSSKDILFDVYDLSGRKITSQVWPNTGSVQHVVSLDNLSQGIYMIVVSDGQHTQIQKVSIR